jgi:hypothetical protein
MPRFVFEGSYPHHVTHRYPELAVRMKCRLCKNHVDVAFKCGCSGCGPMPDISGVQFALDGIRTQVLIALKAACKNPVSTECCAKAPCSYAADFLRLFLVMPDLAPALRCVLLHWLLLHWLLRTRPPRPHCSRRRPSHCPGCFVRVLAACLDPSGSVRARLLQCLRSLWEIYTPRCCLLPFTRLGQCAPLLLNFWNLVRSMSPS